MAEPRMSRTAVAAAAVGLGLLAAAAVPFVRAYADSPRHRPAASFGVAADQAGCDAELTDPVSGVGMHVGPGTSQPTATRVGYETVPPSSGPHYVYPAQRARRFYLPQDRPAMEELVHNLEHGYTVVWYTGTLPAAEVEALRELAVKLGDDAYGEKFIVSAWDDSYGAFPAGRPLAMSHWGRTAGYRQFCARVSGAAIERFVLAHPAADAPEVDGM
ncbi:hypothetical protein CS0771_64790 [Catellatospora sp. IY07-71]|uniref:DUF3105 domain-containing protein n=1 Tax=Catellatospora sp. IY07-71 TaxID=2728827 RepID=UPI001BB46100|nr:DUF3105 domain-containing protein [Catellatospora sp. IY07-71]BCJ76935.1 hypothetical protein CS0771_64790 [Catellatospora sp. IY07-71]